MNVNEHSAVVEWWSTQQGNEFECDYGHVILCFDDFRVPNYCRSCNFAEIRIMFFWKLTMWEEFWRSTNEWLTELTLPCLLEMLYMTIHDCILNFFPYFRDASDSCVNIAGRQLEHCNGSGIQLIFAIISSLFECCLFFCCNLYSCNRLRLLIMAPVILMTAVVNMP